MTTLASCWDSRTSDCQLSFGTVPLCDKEGVLVSVECSPSSEQNIFSNPKPIIIHKIYVVVMQRQLERIYSETLKQYEGEENGGGLFGIEEHLREKAGELERLQRFFQEEILEIQDYERRERCYKRIIELVLKAFDSMKKELGCVRQQWESVRVWKEEVEEGLRMVPCLVERVMKESSGNEEEEMIRSKVEVNEEKFRKIESSYRDQIQNQNKMIQQLEELLKRKSQTKSRISDASLKSIQKQVSLHLRSQNLDLSPSHHHYPHNQSSPYNNTSPLKDIKNAADKSVHKSVSPSQHKPLEKTLSKEEVVEKIRRYKQNRTIKENCDIRQKKPSIVEKKPLQIPSLPELKTISNFKSPITTGFDVLVIDGKQIYKGMWKRGVFEGRGKYYSPTWVYDGDFKNGVIDGFGTINFQSYTFIGKFQNGKAQGEGTLYTKQKPVSGIWRENVLMKQY